MASARLNQRSFTTYPSMANKPTEGREMNGFTSLPTPSYVSPHAFHPL